MNIVNNNTSKSTIFNQQLDTLGTLALPEEKKYPGTNNITAHLSWEETHTNTKDTISDTLIKYCENFFNNYKLDFKKNEFKEKSSLFEKYLKPLGENEEFSIHFDLYVETLDKTSSFFISFVPKYIKNFSLDKNMPENGGITKNWAFSQTEYQSNQVLSIKSKQNLPNTELHKFGTVQSLLNSDTKVSIAVVDFLQFNNTKILYSSLKTMLTKSFRSLGETDEVTITKIFESVIAAIKNIDTTTITIGQKTISNNPEKNEFTLSLKSKKPLSNGIEIEQGRWKLSIWTPVLNFISKENVVQISISHTDTIDKKQKHREENYFDTTPIYSRTTKKRPNEGGLENNNYKHLKINNKDEEE